MTLTILLLTTPTCILPPGTSAERRPTGAFAQPIAPFAMGRPDLVLLVTGSTKGELEPCHCPGMMAGGLARRSGLVRAYREAFPRTFLLDTGDAFRDDDLAPVRNRFVLQGYSQIGYDALALGELEWRCGPTLLRELLSPVNRIAYLSTSISLRGGASLPLQKEIVREWGAFRLAVISDLRDKTLGFVRSSETGSFTVESLEVTAATAARLKRAGCVVVLVVHGDDKQVEEAGAACQADLLLRGHTTAAESVLSYAAGKPVATVGSAQHVGVLALKVNRHFVADVEFRLESVDQRWPGDAQLIKTYEAYTEAALQYAYDQPRKQGLAYVASTECAVCHQPQYQYWLKTAHAHAYATLVKAERAGDPDCLRCHTSGFGTKTGFVSLATTPSLANVNCQDCHRFDLDQHQRDGFRATRSAKKNCIACHTQVTDPHGEHLRRISEVCIRSKSKAAETTSPE